MDSLLEEIIAAGQSNDDPNADVNVAKKILERVTELDSILVEVDPVTAIDERGLSGLLRNTVPICYFMHFLLLEISSENLLFVLEVEYYKREIVTKADSFKWREAALAIYNSFIKSDCPLEINIISAVRNAVLGILEPKDGNDDGDFDDQALVTVFDDSFKACFALMMDTWKRFVNSAIYNRMMKRIRSTFLSDNAVRKSAVKEVLSYFVDKAETPSWNGGGGDVLNIIRDKCMQYLHRANVYNNPDLDPDRLLQNWNNDQTVYVRAVRDYNPSASDITALALKLNDVILIEDMPASGVWKGRLNGRVGTFPSTYVKKADTKQIEDVLFAKDDEAESSVVKNLLPRLFSAVVRSASHIISYSYPPVASWILEGLTGSILAVCQVVGASDSVAQRVYSQKDVRWLQHCSVQVVQHLKTLTETIKKAYESDKRLRQSNPNYLTQPAVASILNIVTDLLRATKELSLAATPVINALLQNPNETNLGSLMRLLSDRATLLETRKTLSQSQAFYKKSSDLLRLALSSIDDPPFLFRSVSMVITACLQIIETVANARQQLDMKTSNNTADELILSMSTIIQDMYTGMQNTIDKGAVNKQMLREFVEKIKKSCNTLDTKVNALVADASQTQNVSEQSMPDSADQHSETEPVHDLVKSIVSAISNFMGAAMKEKKIEYIALADEIKQAAAKLGNKVVFDLNTLGISGIRRFEDIRSDGSDLVSRKMESIEDPAASVQSLMKELAQQIMSMIPKADSDVNAAPARKKAVDKALVVLKNIQSVAYSVSDRIDHSNPVKLNLKKWTVSLSTTSDRLVIAARDTAGLVCSEESIHELKAACAAVVTVTKQLAALIEDGLAQIALSQGSSDDGASGQPVSPFAVGSRKIVSPFDTSSPSDKRLSMNIPRTAAVPASPFNPDPPPIMRTRQGSVSHIIPAFTSGSRRVPAAPAEDDANPLAHLKAELNASLSVMHENVSKVRLLATMAAGVWPPPTVMDDIKSACHAVAVSIKEIMAAFDAVSHGQRNVKEKELAAQLAKWKSIRVDFHSYLTGMCYSLVQYHERRQKEEMEERRKIQQTRQEKHKKASKKWMENAATTDYEKWYKNCTEEILLDTTDDVVIVEDETRQKQIIKAGSLFALVRILTSHRHLDPDYTRAFLMTYRSFTTPVEFLNCLIERYNTVPPEEITNDKQIEYIYVKKIVPIRMRVSAVIKSWLDSHFKEFTDNNGALLDMLREFLDTQMAVTDDNLRELLIKTIQKQIDAQGETVTLAAPQVFRSEPPPTILCEKWFGQQTNLLDISPIEIARQVTLLDFKIYSIIQPQECLNQAWSKAALKDRAPNIRGMIKRSNDLTYYVATEILMRESLEERQQVLCHFIQVAEHCLQLNSFNTVLAIYAGLSSSPVHRLKKTWEVLEMKSNYQAKASWNKLEHLTSSEGNHASYRSALHSVNPPCVPFLGLYLTDLVFLDDGNADTIQVGDQAFINFDKRFKTCAVISEIQQFQLTAYDLREWSQLMKYLCRTDHLFDDNGMYKQSLKVEPRAQT